MVTSIPYQDYHDYPLSPEAEFEEHRHEAHRQANRGIYTLAATKAPELIMNDMFDPPQPVLLLYSSFFDTLAPLQIQEEELGTQIPITKYPSDDEEIFFDFSTVNTSLQPPGIIIQSSEQEQNQQMLREILESSMEDSSCIMSSSESHGDFNFNFFSSSLDNNGENHREKHTLCHCNAYLHRNEGCYTTMGIPSFKLNSFSDLTLAGTQMVSKESYHTATESLNQSISQSNNTDKNLQYINSTWLEGHCMAWQHESFFFLVRISNLCKYDKQKKNI